MRVSRFYLHVAPPSHVLLLHLSHLTNTTVVIKDNKRFFLTTCLLAYAVLWPSSLHATHLHTSLNITYPPAPLDLAKSDSSVDLTRACLHMAGQPELDSSVDLALHIRAQLSAENPI